MTQAASHNQFSSVGISSLCPAATGAGAVRFDLRPADLRTAVLRAGMAGDLNEKGDLTGKQPIMPYETATYNQPVWLSVSSRNLGGCVNWPASQPLTPNPRPMPSKPAPSFIDPKVLYTWKGFEIASGISPTRIREARRAGIE